METDRLDVLIVRRRSWWRFGPTTLDLMRQAGATPRHLARGRARGTGRIAVTRRGDVEIAAGRPIGALMEFFLAEALDLKRMTLLAVSAQSAATTAAHVINVGGTRSTRLSVSGGDVTRRLDPGAARLPEERAAEAAISAAWGCPDGMLDRLLSLPSGGRDRGLARTPGGDPTLAERIDGDWHPISMTALDPTGPALGRDTQVMTVFDLAWEIQVDTIRRLTGISPVGPAWQDIEDGENGTLYDLVDPVPPRTERRP